MNYTIRPATVEDFDILYEMMRVFTVFQKTPERLTLALDQLKADKDIFKCLLAVTEHGEIIGFSTYFFAYYSWTGRAIYMDDLYVKDEFRGLGIGTALLDAVTELARAANCTKLKWQVSKWNEAGIQYYKKMGATIDEVDVNCDLVL